MTRWVSPIAVAAMMALTTSLTLFATLMLAWGPIPTGIVYLASAAVFLELVYRAPVIDIYQAE